MGKHTISMAMFQQGCVATWFPLGRWPLSASMASLRLFLLELRFLLIFLSLDNLLLVSEPRQKQSEFEAVSIYICPIKPTSPTLEYEFYEIHASFPD